MATSEIHPDDRQHATVRELSYSASSDARTPTEEAMATDSMILDEQEYTNMQQVLSDPGLYIGDYTASQDFELLRKEGISVIIAAMRQKYQVPDDFQIHRILVDDNSKTNICRYFAESNAVIRAARKQGKGVLVHCQAGVSRSTTLMAAFLMEEFSMTCDEAVEKIQSVRSVVEPTEFFMHQLEMYERCDCEIDPVKHNEYRRFLMQFNASDMLDNDGVDELILAYYPSPAPSPKAKSPVSDPFGNLSMTPRSKSRASSTASVNSTEARAEIIARVRRSSSNAGRSGLAMTSMAGPSSSNENTKVRRLSENKGALNRRMSDVSAGIRKLQQLSMSKDPDSIVVAVGKGKVVVKGRRIRCKMCRRELAAREHILEHEPGQGQSSFAPHRRDMTQHRIDQQKIKEAQKLREERQQQRQAKAAEEARRLVEEAQNSNAFEDSSDEEDDKQVESAKEAEEAENNLLARRSQQNSATTQAKNPAIAKLRVAMPAPFNTPSTSSSAASSPGPESPPIIAPNSICNSYFTEPLSWMSEQLESGSLGGKLVCPNKKCGSKLGNFDWAGVQCSCGSWICPGFAISASKVDEIVS